MIERIDTRGNVLSPGHYTFTIISVPMKGEFKPGSTYYDFEFMAKVGSENISYKEKIAVWLVGPFLRAIGVTESEPDVFEWDKSSSVGATFDAEIVSEMGKDGKHYRHIRNPMAISGFPKVAVRAKNTDEVPF